RLARRESFFRGATATANLGRRIIDEPELAGLRDVLHQYEVQLDSVVSTSDQSRAIAAVHGLRAREPVFAARPAPPPPPPPASLDDLDFAALAGEEAAATSEPTWAGAGGGLFVRRTLRSGQSIQHEGDV